MRVTLGASHLLRSCLVADLALIAMLAWDEHDTGSVPFASRANMVIYCNRLILEVFGQGAYLGRRSWNLVLCIHVRKLDHISLETEFAESALDEFDSSCG